LLRVGEDDVVYIVVKEPRLVRKYELVADLFNLDTSALFLRKLHLGDVVEEFFTLGINGLLLVLLGPEGLSILLRWSPTRRRSAFTTPRRFAALTRTPRPLNIAF